MNFTEFPKIPRLRREVVITEKIDGTNASVYIALNVEVERTPDNDPWIANVECALGNLWVAAGSRTRWIKPGKTDNAGFAFWVKANAEMLASKLGPGHHFGEWWGSGVQRGYGLPKGEKRFSLFNTHRWKSEFNEKYPVLVDNGGGLLVHDENNRLASTQSIDVPCCHVVPVIGTSIFSTVEIERTVWCLSQSGSFASPGFMEPEGIVMYHTASNSYFKQTIEKDAQPKGKN